MKRVVLFMAALSLVFQASAASVSVSKARQAAQAWASRDAVLGAKLGSSVERAAALSLSAGEKVYAVKMTGGGTVFMAADDDLGPVVAFTAATNDFSALDTRSPLWALLNRDAALRAFVRTNTAAQAGLRTAKASADASAKAASSATTPISYEPSDLRVSPLVRSKWDQGDADGKLCYNRYTPVRTNGLHATCGCVATAMAQIMRYHKFPTAEVAPVTRTCYVNMYAATKANDPNCVTNLTTQAGVYDWENMPLVPKDGATDEQCEAIGKLTSDVGISVYMSYDEDNRGSSNAFGVFVAKALKEVFGYADADFYKASEVSSSSTAMRQGVFANLDAGYPVLMGIGGDEGGHEIIGDGYGYENGKLYVHLNMGWSGEDDCWYNLPDINCGWVKYKVFDDLVFNIIPEGSNVAILTGRVTDEATNAVAGAAVRLYAAGTTTLVSSGETSANGVYAFRVPAGTYDVAVAKSGCPAEMLSSVKVAKTQTRTETITINRGVGWSTTYSDIPFVTSFGNSYGNDITLVEPRARIVLGEVTNVYATLDAALADGRTFVEAGSPGVIVEILGDLPLSATATVDFPCALMTAADAAAAVSVVRSGNAALAVASGATLALSNVTFAANASTAVTVASGGRLAVASGVDFGVTPSIAAVTTEDAAGFVMAGELTAGFAIDCAAAPDVGGVFGTARCDYLTASNGASMVSNVRDTLGETRGVAVEEGGAILLKWGETPVPLADSAGYFVDATGTTNTAARLDRLLEKYANLQTSGAVGDVGEIVVRNLAGLELTRRVAVTGDLTLRGETAGVTIASFGAAAGFDVGDGASLTVRDLAFDGYRGDSLFRVDGGELAIGGVTAFTGIEGTNTYSGAIAVLSGKATVGSSGGSVVFDGCFNDTANSCGGAIYLKDAACELVLQDRVAITNCSARSAGGGVYVGKAAVARLSGYLTIEGNEVVTSANKSSASDIGYYRTSATAAHTLILSGLLETGSAVGVQGAGSYASSVMKANGTFLAVDEAFTDRAKILQSCERFFCDAKEGLAAVPSDDYATLLWEADDGSIKTVDPSAAVASVTGADGVAAYYGSLEDAFGVVTGEATVEVLANVALQGDVTVTNAVTLTSGAGGPFVVFRAADCRISVLADGALTLADVTVSGALDSFRYGTGVLFDVQYGELTLGDGATVQDVTSGDANAGCAIKVYKGALTMLDGSVIRYCANAVSGNSRGGAVTADTFSRVRLLGGEVADCTAESGGGVYIGNETTVEVGGGFVATENATADGTANNLYVASKSTLLLVSPFTGDVGYVPGVAASSNVFGRVASDFSGTAAEAADSAHNFTHDLTGDVGFAVAPASGSGDTLLVWSDALDANGNVTVNGTNYVTVTGGATLTAEVTDTTTGFVYTGAAQAPTFSGHGFVVTVDAQTSAGDYTATLTPKAGFVWEDGTTAARTVSWTIAKAEYDMSGVTFESQTFTYDGEPHSLAIDGTLPDGVAVSYTGNGQTEVGEYTVTAVFTVADTTNYKAIPSLTATLTIVAEPEPEPDPEPDPVVTNSPTPIAFQSIERLAEGSWRLVVTNRVPWCWYRLLSTDDLMKGFTTTNDWEQAPADATPAWTNDVETAGEALFWRAEGKEGEVGK